MTNALQESLPPNASTANRRGWIHVGDYCAAIGVVLEFGRLGETYKVGTGVERSTDEVAELVLDVLGKPKTLKTIVKDRPGQDRRYLLDSSKIRTVLGWKQRIDFATGLAQTVGWYVKNEGWLRRLIARADVNERNCAKA